MEMDELKAAWQELAAQAETDRAMHRNLRRDWGRDHARLELRGASVLPLIELGMNLLAALWLGSFLAKYIAVPRFAIPALCLHAVTILLIGASIWQLAALGRLDYAGPVVALQRRLTEIRAARLRVNRWILMLCPLLWTPLAIVTAQGVFHWDLYRTFGPAWIAANLLFGALMIPVLLWAAGVYRDRLSHSSFWQTLADDLTGRRLTAAIVFLDDIARFEEG